MKNRAANLSPCERCGACCATFRVDFSIIETQAEGGAVPDGLALPVAARTCRLRGTDHLPPRCAALSGCVGERVAWGDAGTEAAARDGNIKVIKHLDVERNMWLFGLYARVTTIAYGD